MAVKFSFCENEVKQSDYNRYICCLLVNDYIRHRLLAIYAFNNEIAKIKDVISEPMAGHIRLQWWRDAIEEIYNGKPIAHRHEIVDALYEVVSEVDINKELFDSLIDAREADIEFDNPENMASLENYAEATSSNLFKLLLAAAGINDAKSLEAAHYGGMAYALTGIMRSMKYNAYHRHVMFPKDMMAGQGITAEDVTEGRNLEQTRPIVRAICAKAEVNLNHVRALKGEISKDTMRVLLPVSTVEIYLKRVKKCGYDLFNCDLERGKLGVQLKIYKSKVLGTV